MEMAADNAEILLIGQAKPVIVGGVEPFATVHKLVEAKDAALVMGQPAPACEHLARAIEQIPETSGWKYLAAMYAEVAAHQRS